jgi:hypothetical protein
MTDSSRPKFVLDEWNTLWAAQKAREDARCMVLFGLVAVIPVPDEILQEIAWLGPGRQTDVLTHHPGSRIARKIESLWTVLDVFELAHADLQAHLETFNAFSLSPEMGRTRGKQALMAIESAVKKELMAFSAAASALVEHARRANQAAPVLQFKEQRNNIFHGPEHRFITSIRNLISHEAFPSVGWQIQLGDTRTTDFVMSSSALLLTEGLHAEARQFIESCGKQIHVSRVAASYSERVRAFYKWYKEALDEARPTALTDYQRIVKQCRIVSKRNWYRLLAHQAMSANANPYEHLDKFLLPEQVEVALKMTHRSKEQVDFIIGAADEHGACDDELRAMVYRLFQVPGHETPTFD